VFSQEPVPELEQPLGARESMNGGGRQNGLGFSYLLNAFLESLAVRNYSERTIAGRGVYLGYFIQMVQ
jgi:hypothetical protein